MHGSNAHAARRKLTKLRSMIYKGFMTSHTIIVLHRLNTTVFSQLKPE